MKSVIPVYEPTLGEASRRYAIECLDTNWISSKGRFIDEFEKAFALRTGIAHCASVSNGTVALHLALLALDIGPGDEVIVPTFTYVASVNAIAYVGATPVFVDSRNDGWQLDPDDVRLKVTKKTKAIMAVHLYGQPVDMRTIMDIARDNNLYVVEDCAEAFGSYVANAHVGTFGDVATYSFFGNKTITTGEGGAVVTKSADLDSKIRKLRGQGLAGTKEYWHDVVGYNYRMTNICAAIGLGQLELANDFLSRKRSIATKIKEGVAGLPLKFLWELDGTTSSYWMNTVGVEDPRIRDQLRGHLSAAGIETRPAFYPAHTMPMYQKYAVAEYPIAELIASSGINLPSAPSLSDDQVGFIINTVKTYFQK